MPKKARIYDAVYGYVELDEFEFELVTSPIFQRLHRIKQLGPLHTVFPSAQHSRFSHTIGVFYIVTKMMEHLENRPDEYKYDFRKEEKQKELLKFAALLHDIGHVPLSHVGEEVLKETTEEKLREKFMPKTKDKTFDPFEQQEIKWWKLFPEKQYLGGSTKLHERLSAEIVLHNEEIDKVLSKVWQTKEDCQKAKTKIAQIIVGQDETDVPTLLLHSELDADRLDYLLRDSFFTGVGYGKVDLDYIISRLVIFRGEDNFADLCVENKGLHTVEHYILSRFFLQTQVIFNRKVRFIDLLFEDVMRYMVKHEDKDWCLMGLEEFRNRIRHEEGDLREDLHKIYAYTDAQVFSKMRKLHEELDRKGRENGMAPEEEYINDCVKTIMDGEIDEPVESCQKIINLAEDEDAQQKLENKAKAIAKKLAKECGIYEKRVKTNFVCQEVMKYKQRVNVGDGEGEEANREAVRIMYKKNSLEKIISAAQSNATILKDLADTALVIFNVYYVRSKSESDEEIKANREAIKVDFSEFVTEEFKS